MATENFGDATLPQLVTLAQAAEAAELYDDMCEFMSKLVKQKSDLSVEERNLLSVAFKNVVGAQRSALRALDGENEQALVDKYKSLVQRKLQAKCEEVIQLLDDYLIPNTKGKSDESEVFYLKMSGDYYRYLAEFVKDPKYSTEAEKQYGAALDVAKTALEPTHPTRLGLALNFSVCYYEILGRPQEACTLAKDAFDTAIEKLDALTDASYKDSTLIMQLLRDNLTLWTSEENTGDD